SVVMTPLTTITAAAGPGSMSPYPVATRPGSMPRNRWLGSRDGLEYLVGNVVVGVDGLYVVQILQRLDELDHGGGVLRLDPHGRLRNVRDLPFDDRHARPRQRVAHGVHLSRRRRDLKSFFGATHVGSAGVEGLLDQIVLGDLVGADGDDALALEHPRDGARGAHVAAELLERVSDLWAGAVSIVGQDADHDGDAAGRVAVVGDLLVRLAGQLAGALLDGALDVVLRHVDFLGGLDRRLQPHVALRIAATIFRRDRDLAEDLGEELAALDVGLALLTLDLRPPRMACHRRYRFSSESAALSRFTRSSRRSRRATAACHRRRSPSVRGVKGRHGCGRRSPPRCTYVRYAVQAWRISPLHGSSASTLTPTSSDDAPT